MCNGQQADRTSAMRVFCVAALQRSGYHAIVNWIAANSSVPTEFLNNCAAGMNPLHGSGHGSRRLLTERSEPHAGRPPLQIVHSYEDQSLETIAGVAASARSAGWFQGQATHATVLVLRDP